VHLYSFSPPPLVLKTVELKETITFLSIKKNTT
jgi:hypothetical protein